MAEEVFFRAAVQGGLAHALHLSSKGGDGGTSMGMAALVRGARGGGWLLNTRSRLGGIECLRKGGWGKDGSGGWDPDSDRWDLD